MFDDTASTVSNDSGVGMEKVGFGGCSVLFGRVRLANTYFRGNRSVELGGLLYRSFLPYGLYILAIGIAQLAVPHTIAF